MQQSALIQSKITHPRIHDKIVHRERLTNLIHENIHKNLIIICAPAGFGKTTLVLDYLSKHKGVSTWLSVPRRGIEDVSTFYEYNIGALKSLNKDFGKNTLEVMQQYSSDPKMSTQLASACTAAFVNEFQNFFKDDVICVIDDLHYIEPGKWLKALFDQEFDNVPPNLHLIIITRTMPDFNLTNLRTKRNVRIINENELSFRAAETAALLRDVYGIKYDKYEVKFLDEILRGWITGLHLLLQAYGEDFSKIKYTGEIDLDTIFDFFAQEIFDNLSRELQEFLMVTSLMEGFDEELSNAVLGINNSRKLTNELIHKNLFIHQIQTAGKNGESPKISYGYHALFRDFLNRRLQNSRAAQQVDVMLEKIGDSYLSSGDEISAINYFLESKNFDKAVSLIINIFQSIYDSGKYDVLWRWFRSIPENIINKNANLIYYLSFLYLYTNTDYEKAMSCSDRATELFVADNDEDGLMKSFLVKAHILELTGKAEEAASETQKLLKRCRKPKNVIYIYNLLSTILSISGNFKEAEAVLKSALEYCSENNLDQKQIAKLDYAFGILYYNSFDFEKALFYFKKCLENHLSVYNLILNNCNIAVTYNDMGDYSNSIKYFDIAFKMLEQSNSRELSVHMTGQKALLLHNIGDYENSIKLLEDEYQQAQISNALFYLWQCTDLLFLNYCFLGDRANSLKYLKLNKTYTETLGAAQNKKLFQTRETLYLMKYEPDPTGEQKLIDSYSYFEPKGGSYKKSVMFWLAEYYLITNKPEAALKSIGDLLRQSYLGANDLIDSRDLIDFALSRRELNKYREKIHSAFAEFFDRLKIEGTSDEYKKKMEIEIDNLYDIRMISFGVPEFVSRGLPISDSKWRKKKGKSVLAYMMLNPKAKHSKDKIIELFFHDLRKDTVEDSFKQAIFSIRSAFKNNYLNFLILEDKTLYLNPDCYFKSDAEEFNKYYRKAHTPGLGSKERIDACMDAIALYKGEFMEGNYEPWCEDMRSDLHNKLILVSELLIHFLRLNKSYEKIVHYSEFLLKHDNLNEIAYLSLVEAYVKLEKRKSAKDSFSKMIRTYKEELEELPDEKISGRIKNLLEN